MIDRTGKPRSDKDLQDAIDCITEIMVKHPLVLPLLTVHAGIIRDCLLELQRRRKGKITVEELVKSVAEWVKENADRESIFLSANPQWSVNAHNLLDHICSVTGITKEQIGKWLGEE